MEIYRRVPFHGVGKGGDGRGGVGVPGARLARKTHASTSFPPRGVSLSFSLVHFVIYVLLILPVVFPFLFCVHILFLISPWTYLRGENNAPPSRMRRSRVLLDARYSERE